MPVVIHEANSPEIRHQQTDANSLLQSTPTLKLKRKKKKHGIYENARGYSRTHDTGSQYVTRRKQNQVRDVQ